MPYTYIKKFVPYRRNYQMYKTSRRPYRRAVTYGNGTGKKRCAKGFQKRCFCKKKSTWKKTTPRKRYTKKGKTAIWDKGATDVLGPSPLQFLEMQASMTAQTTDVGK